MKIISGVFNLLLFLLALGFALANTEVVDLHFMLSGMAWRAPLVLFLLVFFAVGLFLGFIAAVPSLFRKHREIAALKEELKRLASSEASLKVSSKTIEAGSVPRSN